MPSPTNLPATLRALEESPWGRPPLRGRSVRDEIRENLLRAIAGGEELFAGVHGYEDTVLPQIVNALLARHDFILLGLRGQAKSRILRGLTGFLDEWLPIIAGSEVNDDPFGPISKYGRERLEQDGGATPIGWVHRHDRYVEKLATPDVTIADLIGDLDRKSTRLNSSHSQISYAVFCLKKKKTKRRTIAYSRLIS